MVLTPWRMGVVAFTPSSFVVTNKNNFDPKFKTPTTAATLSSRLFAASSSSIVLNKEEVNSILPIEDDANAIICGGGPAGLLSAIMLAQTFPDWKRIVVYDCQLKNPPDPNDEAIWNDVAKFYLLGLGSRGQNALDYFNVWKDDILPHCTAVVGRRDWSPESSADEPVERIFTDRPVTTQVLPRDKLVGALYRHVKEKYSDQIQVYYGYEIEPIDLDYKQQQHGDKPMAVVRVNKCKPNGESDENDILCNAEESKLIQAPLLIAADGTARTVANQIQKFDQQQQQKKKWWNSLSLFRRRRPFFVKRYQDDNQRIYKTIPMQFADTQKWRWDLNYSARCKGGRVTFDALPANSDGNYCGVLLLKRNDPMANPDSDPKELRKLFQDYLPQFSPLISDDIVRQVAKKGPSFLPSFRYVGPRLHQGSTTVLLGDCAHTVKPYFGLGANSALQDVKILSETLRSNNLDISKAIISYSKQQAKEARALVRLSRELDRPGLLGFITFILPLILDATFYNLFPKFFAPNVIAMLQRDGTNFVNVARRKRQDRILQIGIIFGTLGTAFWGTTQLVRRILSFRWNANKNLMGGSFLALTLLLFGRRYLAPYLIPGMAPADVMNKAKGVVTDSDTFVTPLGMKQNNDDKNKVAS